MANKSFQSLIASWSLKYRVKARPFLRILILYKLINSFKFQDKTWINFDTFVSYVSVFSFGGQFLSEMYLVPTTNFPVPNSLDLYVLKSWKIIRPFLLKVLRWSWKNRVGVILSIFTKFTNFFYPYMLNNDRKTKFCFLIKGKGYMTPFKFESG